LILSKYGRDHASFIGPDNMTSLPLENGERDFFPKLDYKGAFRRIRSNITLEKQNIQKFVSR